MKKIFTKILFVIISILFITNVQLAFAQDDNTVTDNDNQNVDTGDLDGTIDDDNDMNANEYDPNRDTNDINNGVTTTETNDTIGDNNDNDIDDDNDYVENITYGAGGALLGGAVMYLILRYRRPVVEE